MAGRLHGGEDSGSGTDSGWSVALHQEACPMSIDCPILCWLLSPGRQARLHLHFTEGPRPVWSPCGLPEVKWQEEVEEEAWGQMHQWPEQH